MNIRFVTLLFAAFLLLNLPSKAQKTTSNGPETEIGDAAKIVVFGEDDNYLYIFSSDRDMFGGYDDSYITIYDKNKNSMVNEYEFDDDYECLTAYLDGNNVVAVNGKYNKKTKCVEYGKTVIPIQGKAPKKFVFTPIVSVPTNGLEEENICAFLSSDRTKLAFVTYLHPKKNDNEYVLDARIFDLDGNEISHVNEHVNAPCADRVNGWLTPDGTIYLDENIHMKANVKFTMGGVYAQRGDAKRFSCVTASGEVVLCKMDTGDEPIYDPITAILPNQHLFVAGATDKGIFTIEFDGNGEGEAVLHELEIPERPEKTQYGQYYNELKSNFYPNQILPLSNGNILILGYESKLVVSTDINGKMHTDYYHRNIHLFLIDNKGELIATTTLPSANVNNGAWHKDTPRAFELNNEVYLIFNDNKINYNSSNPKIWKALEYNKGSQECVVAGKLDSDLNLSPEIIYKPKSQKDFNNIEYFEEIINTSNDAVYYILRRDGGNHIEVLTEE